MSLLFFNKNNIAQTDFEYRYIVTSGTVKQFKLIFDKSIDKKKKQLKNGFKLF
jgi:hypothetical protein